MSNECEYPVTGIVTREMADKFKVRSNRGRQRADPAGARTQNVNMGLTSKNHSTYAYPRVEDLGGNAGETEVSSADRSYTEARGGLGDTDIVRRCRQCLPRSCAIRLGQVLRWNRVPGCIATQQGLIPGWPVREAAWSRLSAQTRSASPARRYVRRGPRCFARPSASVWPLRSRDRPSL